MMQVPNVPFTCCAPLDKVSICERQARPGRHRDGEADGTREDPGQFGVNRKFRQPERRAFCPAHLEVVHLRCCVAADPD